MSKRKGVGNVHTHHLDLRCLPENITKQQSGLPEWFDDTALKDAVALFSPYLQHFFTVMTKDKSFGLVSDFHLKDMIDADIDYSVVLHIDFEGADPKAKDWNYQYEYVIDKIAQACAKYPFRFFPFFGFDPRRPRVVNMLETNFKERCYVGIKLYPATGFDPRPYRGKYVSGEDYFPHTYKESGKIEAGEVRDNLQKMYSFAEKNNIPIITHCGPGGTYRATVNKKDKYKHIWKFTNPSNFQQIAASHSVRICFAHDGGKIDYEKEDKISIEWNKTIRDLIKKASSWDHNGKIYSDQSYGIGHLINEKKMKKKMDENIVRTRKELDDKILGNYLLFGSDWPLNVYKCTEKQYIDEYRERLNKQQQEKYFSDNIATYLFGISRQIPHNYINYLKAKNTTLELPDWVEEVNGNYFLK